MEFESPDVEKDFPGLYASESGKKSNESDFSDDNHEKVSKKDLLIGKRKDKKDSKKDRGYATLEGESSPEEDITDVKNSSLKFKKSKPFKFPSKKEKREKSREKDNKEKDVEKEKKKDSDKDKKKDKDYDKDKKKDGKIKLKSSKERRKVKNGDECSDVNEERPIFGVPLAVALERSRCHDGIEIPLVVRQCIMHVEDNGLWTEGIYKVSGIKAKVQHVRRLYNLREAVNLSDYDITVVTSLLKLYFRELPECILTSKLYGKFEEAANIRDVAMRSVELGSLVKQMPYCNVQLLSWIIKHLLSVTMHEKHNKMSQQSISQVFSQPLQISQRLVSAFISHADLLFNDTKLIKYIPPLTSSNNLPETANEITNELCKQESLLGQIHFEMNAGYVTKEREELLWEVQRIITQLKRKYRSIEREAFEAPVNKTTHINDTANAAEAPQQSNAVTAEKDLSKAKNSGLQSDHDDSEQTICSEPKTIIVKAFIESPPSNFEDSTNAVETKNNKSNDIIITKAENIISSQNFEDISKESATESAVIKNNDKEELELKLETEELLTTIASLQNQIREEKFHVYNLKEEVRNLGGSPSFCTYLISECWNNDFGTRNNSFLRSDGNVKDRQNSIDGSALEEAKAQTISLQIQRRDLLNNIIEEEASLVKMKVQAKLLALKPTQSNVSIIH